MVKTKHNTIKSQVFSGYVVVTFMIAIFVIFSTLSLLGIRYEYMRVSDNRQNQSDTMGAVAGHYDWLEQLSQGLLGYAEFKGSTDYNTCSLGKWLNAVDPQSLKDPQISASLNQIITPHQEIHSSASGLLQQSKTDQAGAYNLYESEVKAKVSTIIGGLTDISNRYKTIADEAAESLKFFLIFSIVFSFVLAIIVFAFSITFAKRVSNRISGPIIAVSEWSKKLAMGAENLNFAQDMNEKEMAEEIDSMIISFKDMVASVQENVNVVRRVADGDMTAFVNIRSSSDTLGKNLYRMVQSNDLLFNEIMQIARQVAVGSAQISQSSQSLAENASLQAAAVQGLSETIDMASELVRLCSDKTHQATDISASMETEMMQSQEKMEVLVESVNGIRDASEKISAVIKSIDDIAFQTNILALNAAVEAARAGEAGKGFAVVANEVRELALKSANAAQETKVLIENTISRTLEGSAISHEASALFATTIENINKIIAIVLEVNQASDEQRKGIETVREEIGKINDAASGYAAVSEESAASSHEMNENAELLRKAMSTFNLRKRQQGHAYIPPEKRNDADFIRLAEENYRKALAEGKADRVELSHSLPVA